MSDHRDGPVGTVRFTDVLSAELGKLRTLPQVWAALAAATLANTALGALAATDAVRVAGADGQTPIGQVGTLMLAPVYIFVAIAVYAAGSEYRGGQLRISLAAVPDRNRLFAAKFVVGAAASVVAAVLAAVPGYLIQRSWAPGATGGGTGTTTGVAALLASYLLLSLTGFGLAVVARTAVFPLTVLPVAAFLAGPTLRGTLPDLVRFLPHEATLSLLGTPSDPTVALGRGGGLLVLAACAAGCSGAAWRLFTSRDS